MTVAADIEAMYARIGDVVERYRLVAPVTLDDCHALAAALQTAAGSGFTARVTPAVGDRTLVEVRDDRATLYRRLWITREPWPE